MTSFSRIILLTTLSVCLKRSNAAWTTADLTPKNYNPLRLPKVDDQPVTVWITLDVMSLLAVDEAEQVQSPFIKNHCDLMYQSFSHSKLT